MAYFRTYYYNCTSEAGISYRVEFYDQAASVIFRKEGTPGKSPVKIKWGSDGASMFAPFKPSTCTINFMVTDLLSADYIRQLRTERQEQDVYVAIYRETVVGSASPQEEPIWGGFILMDLSADPDQAIPFNVTLKAIDGIAALKYYDYVPNTTTQSPDGLYNIADTFIPAPGNTHGTWRKFKTIISDCFDYLGEFGTDEGNVITPRMLFAVGWFNGEMSSATVEPLSNSRVQAALFYKEEEITDEILKYKPKTCYDVLKAICKAWGMRLFYWKNCYYFIQISQFRKNQIGSQLVPDDIHNYQYKLDGTFLQNVDTIQSTWGTYSLCADSRYWGSKEKSKKRAGGQYGILPAFKKVTVDFANVDNVNRFTSFPTIPGPFNSGAGQYFNFTHLCFFESDGINDQFFFQRIYLDVINNQPTWGTIKVNWGLFARNRSGAHPNTPNASPVDNEWDFMLKPDMSSPTGHQWAYVANWSFSGMPINDEFHVPPGTSTIEITDSPTWGTILNFPPLPIELAPNWDLFTAGEWELGYYVESYVNLIEIDPAVGFEPLMCLDAGEFSPYGYSGGITSPYYYDVSWANVQIQQGIGASEFAPIINGSVGSASTTTSLVQTGDDTAFQEIKDILFGDTGTATAEGCIQIWDGTQWTASDFSGIWGIDTLAGGNSMSQQLASDILDAQSQPIHKFTVSTVIDPTLGIYWNDGSADRPQFPFPGTKWNTKAHAASGTIARDWIMHTGAFDIEQDTWKWVLYEQEYFAPAIPYTVVVNTHGGWNSGLSGGPNNPTPTGGVLNPKLGNPAGYGNALIRDLQSKQSKPITEISTFYQLPIWIGVGPSGEMPTSAPSLTITSLAVYQMPTAMLKAGDKINVNTGNTRTYKTFPTIPLDPPPVDAQPNPYMSQIITFEVATDQAADATSISVTSKVIYQNIPLGSWITLDTQSIVQQGNDKTRGTVGGFEVSATGLEKGGITIDEFLDSATMTGAASTKLSTSSSIKSYADTKQSAISLTTTGTSGAATFADNTLNVPQYSGGGSVTSNYKYYVCSVTETSSSTVDVLSTVPYAAVQAYSSASNIIFYESAGPSGKTNGEFSFSMGTGTFQIGWNVGTIPGTAFNRYLGGVKLQKGVLEGTAIVWSDVPNTNSFIYDRGLSSTLQGGSTSNTILYKNTLSTNYFRIVFWKHQSSNSSTTLITQTDACGIYLIEQQ